MAESLIIFIVLLLFSGFFSSAETALFSISRTRAIHLAKEKGKAFKLIQRMKQDSHTLLSTILIGNNLVNVAAAAIATQITIKAVPNYAIGLATGAVTFLILVFGEVFPKSMAARNNVLIARLSIYPIFWFSLLFFPVIKFLNFIPWLTGRMARPQSVTEEELMTFVEVVEGEGEIKEEEKELIHNVFELDDTNASEIMTPRADMFVVEVEQPLQIKEIIDSGFSRIPVIEGSIDNVIGILHIKDLFMHVAACEDPIDVRSIMRKPYFVPEYKKLDSLLHQFKKRKNHLAIVVDEHGGVSGLITLEDALEELVGEISDETDKEEPHITPLKSRAWIVLGKTDIEDVNDEIGMGIPDSPAYDTFSGYILNRLGKIPQENEEIQIDSFTITVKIKDGNRIKEYLVKQKVDPPLATTELSPTS
jgi:CBS domain containing-hemolysin-like protein